MANFMTLILNNDTMVKLGKYQGCSYYMGINTSGTNYKTTENANGRPRSLIRNQDKFSRNGLDPNSWTLSHKIVVFGISTAGINTRVI